MAKSNKGITPLTVAIREDMPLMVRLLIEFGYRLDKRFEWGETPLEMAIRLHHEDCALTMVIWGASLKQKDRKKPSFFTLACSEGLHRLIQLLIDLKPDFLNEKWVLNRKVPLAMYRDPCVAEEIFSLAKQPRSLRQWCISKIFRYIGKWPVANVDKLPLPVDIRNEMKFEKYFSVPLVERKYVKRDVFARDCPYDCAVVCDRAPQCPVIEFSDSGSEFELDLNESGDETSVHENLSRPDIQ